MSETGDYASLEELVFRINPEYQLVRAWPLAGGVSAQVTALEIVQPDEQMRRMVVRRHGAADLAANPNIAADEFRLLKRLREADLPAPEPIYVDADGEILGAPCLVAAYIEGTPEFAPPDVNAFVGEMAALLARIHGISGEEVAFLPAMQAIAAAKLRTRPEASFRSCIYWKNSGFLIQPIRACCCTAISGRGICCGRRAGWSV